MRLHAQSTNLHWRVKVSVKCLRIHLVAHSCAALAGAHSEMGNKLINVAITEAHPPLANAFRKIGRTWHSVADLDQAQAISECVVIGDSLGYQGMNARSAKETLQMRTGVLEEYQAAVKTTISKRRQIERLKASSNIRPDKVDDALEDMEEVCPTRVGLSEMSSLP